MGTHTSCFALYKILYNVFILIYFSLFYFTYVCTSHCLKKLQYIVCNSLDQNTSHWYPESSSIFIKCPNRLIKRFFRFILRFFHNLNSLHNLNFFSFDHNCSALGLNSSTECCFLSSNLNLYIRLG